MRPVSVWGLSRWIRILIAQRQHLAYHESGSVMQLVDLDASINSGETCLNSRARLIAVYVSFAHRTIQTSRQTRLFKKPGHVCNGNSCTHNRSKSRWSSCSMDLGLSMPSMPRHPSLPSHKQTATVTSFGGNPLRLPVCSPLRNETPRPPQSSGHRVPCYMPGKVLGLQYVEEWSCGLGNFSGENGRGCYVRLPLAAIPVFPLTHYRSPPKRLVDDETGSEFSLEYLPNPDDVIRILNDIPVNLKFEDEDDENDGEGKASQHKTNELLNRLEALNGIDNSNERLGIYNQAERVERLNQYRQKRQQRNFGNSKVRYVVRQKASENRVRVHGRFAVTTADAAPAAQKPTTGVISTTTAAVSPPISKEEEWVFELDEDQPDKMMRRTAASSSLSWIVQHHRKSSITAEQQRKRTINSSIGSHADFVTARGMMLARGSSAQSLGSFVSLTKEIALLESHLLVELEKKH
ncbi:hypothetical protein BASA81_007555 [Batrachochytrium salamandrivorans]|nr:hypothetical protein BASA81_007555 [Batrachochytrium salamandrivorans]